MTSSIIVPSVEMNWAGDFHGGLHCEKVVLSENRLEVHHHSQLLDRRSTAALIACDWMQVGDAIQAQGGPLADRRNGVAAAAGGGPAVPLHTSGTPGRMLTCNVITATARLSFIKR